MKAGKGTRDNALCEENKTEGSKERGTRATEQTRRESELKGETRQTGAMKAWKDRFYKGKEAGETGKIKQGSEEGKIGRKRRGKSDRNKERQQKYLVVERLNGRKERRKIWGDEAKWRTRREK